MKICIILFFLFCSSLLCATGNLENFSEEERKEFIDQISKTTSIDVYITQNSGAGQIKIENHTVSHTVTSKEKINRIIELFDFVEVDVAECPYELFLDFKQGDITLIESYVAIGCGANNINIIWNEKWFVFGSSDMPELSSLLKKNE